MMGISDFAGIVVTFIMITMPLIVGVVIVMTHPLPAII